MLPVQSGLCTLGIVLFVPSALLSQTLKVTTEFILFDCTARPALFQDYKHTFAAPEEQQGVDLEVRKAVIGYLRNNAPVQRSVRSVDIIQVGQRARKTVKIGHQVLSIQLLAHPAARGAYPMQIQQKCIHQKRPELSSSNHSQLLQMVPNRMHIRHTSWNQATATASTSNEKVILFWLTTLSEHRPLE